MCTVEHIVHLHVFGAAWQVQLCCGERPHTEFHPEKALWKCRMSFTRALPTLQRCKRERGEREGEKVATEENPRGPAGGRDRDR